MPKQRKKTSTSGTHSYIFSDYSKQMYREQNMARKLKHLQEQNCRLEQKIKEQEEQIKDERVLIIYQMEQLTKSVNNKLGLFQDYTIDRSRFANEEHAHQVVRDLMGQYENIQKEQRLISKVKSSIQKMYGSYIEHKEQLQKIMQENSQTHRQTYDKLTQHIQQRKKQYAQTFEHNRSIQQQRENMEEEMKQFNREQYELEIQQQELIKMIEQKQKQIEEESNKYEQICRLTNIVVDKAYRFDLGKKIDSKNCQLAHLQKNKNNIEIALREQILNNTLC